MKKLLIATAILLSASASAETTIGYAQTNIVAGTAKATLQGFNVTYDHDFDGYGLIVIGSYTRGELEYDADIGFLHYSWDIKATNTNLAFGPTFNLTDEVKLYTTAGISYFTGASNNTNYYGTALVPSFGIGVQVRPFEKLTFNAGVLISNAEMLDVGINTNTMMLSAAYNF